MRLDAIWRYPVKSMAGERLVVAELTNTGVVGDRILQVYGADGRIVTARRFPRLLRMHATLGTEGEPVVDGLPWNSPEVALLVEAAVGPGAHLARYDGPERFDILPLLVCTDGSVAMFGRDVRRLRPNLVIGGVLGVAERNWSGSRLTVGGVEIALEDLRARCVMTTYDPETGRQDPGVLSDIVRRFDGRLCLNASVVRAGTVREADAVAVRMP